MSRRALRSETKTEAKHEIDPKVNNEQLPTQTNRLRRIANIHDLDMKHQSLAHKSDTVIKDEEARRLKLRLLQLRDENSILRDQSAQKDVRIRHVVDELNQLRGEVETVKETSHRQENDLKERAREAQRLEAELKSLNSVAKDSSNILTEKLVLCRELDSLRPEVEHLRTQLSQQKGLMTDKLALERLVDSLEAELMAEKRSKQQARTREDAKALEELQQRLDEAEKRTMAGAKMQEEARKENDRKLSEAVAETEAIQERAETLKTKLKSAQAELKTCRAELAVARQAAAASSSEAWTKSRPTTAGRGVVGRKRQAADISADDITQQTTILAMTPDRNDARGKRPLKKKALLEQTLVGEKSMFSITPFLNRSRAIADESTLPETESPSAARASEQTEPSEAIWPQPLTEPEEPAAEALSETPDVPTTARKGRPAKGLKPRGRPTTKPPLAESVSRKNLPTPVAAAEKRARKNAAASELENVPEEEELEGAAGQENNRTESFQQPDSAAMNQGKQFVADGGMEKKKKKKRKLLAGARKTFLNDDDGVGEEDDAAAAAVVVVPAVAVPTTAALAKAPRGGRTTTMAKVPVAAAPGASRILAKTHLGPVKAAAAAFGTGGFSPLKRDRRGLNASFLA